MRLDLRREKVGDLVGQVPAPVRFSGLQEHQGRREQAEHEQERDNDTGGHHPAEVDNRPDSAE